VNVTVADLDDVDVFAPAVTDTLAPDDPEDGDTVTHDAFDDADHDEAFVVGTTTTCPPPTGAAHNGCDKDSVTAAWVTVSSRSSPPAVNVTTPERGAPVVFAPAVNVTLAPDAPDVRDSDSHDAVTEADHDG
jgi:hypothetical protein